MSLMYAPHGHAQNLCHRVLSVACPGLLTVADIKGDVGATRESCSAPDGESSHHEAGAHTLPYGGAATHEPFPNLRRGFKEHVEHSLCHAEADVGNPHTQPNHQMPHRPCGVSIFETEGVVWTVRTIPHHDHPHINGCGCDRQRLQQSANHDARVRNHFCGPFLSSSPLT